MFWLGVVLIGLTALNFVSWSIIRAFAGGTAIHAENDHYYVYNRNYPPDPSRQRVIMIKHMPCTEVSRNTYRWLYFQEQSQPITVLAGALGAYLVVRAKRS